MEKKVCIHEGEYGVECKPFEEVSGFANNFYICTRCGSILRLRSSKNNKYSEATCLEILRLFEIIEGVIKDEKNQKLAITDTSVKLIYDKLRSNISKSLELSGYTVIKGAIRKFIKYKDLKIAIEYLIAHNIFAETAKKAGASVAYTESGIPVATQKSKEEKDDKMDKELEAGSREAFKKFIIDYKLNLDTRGLSKAYEDAKSHTWERLYTFKPFADGRESVVIDGCKTCGKIVVYYDNSSNLIDSIDTLILAESKYIDKYKDNLLDMQKSHCTKLAEKRIDEARKVAKETGVPVLTAAQKLNEEKDDVKMDKEIKAGSAEEIIAFAKEGLTARLVYTDTTFDYLSAPCFSTMINEVAVNKKFTPVVQWCGTAKRIAELVTNEGKAFITEFNIDNDNKDFMLKLILHYNNPKVAVEMLKNLKTDDKFINLSIITLRTSVKKEINEEKDDVKMDKEIKVGSEKEMNMFLNEGLKLGAYIAHAPYEPKTTQSFKELAEFLELAKVNSCTNEITAKSLLRTAEDSQSIFNGTEFITPKVYIDGFSDGSVAVWYNDLQSAFQMLKHLNMTIEIDKNDKDIVVFKSAIARLTYGLFQNLMDEYMEEATNKFFNAQITNYNNNIEPTVQEKPKTDDSVKLADAINSSAAKVNAPFSEHAEEASSILNKLAEIKGVKNYLDFDTVYRKLEDYRKPEECAGSKCTCQQGDLFDKTPEKISDSEDVMNASVDSINAVQKFLENSEKDVMAGNGYYHANAMAEDVLDLRRNGFSDEDILNHIYMEVFLGTGFQSADSLSSKAQLEEIKAMCHLRAAQIFRYATEDNGRGIFDEEELSAPIEITIS